MIGGKPNWSHEAIKARRRSGGGPTELLCFPRNVWFENQFWRMLRTNSSPNINSHPFPNLHQTFCSEMPSTLVLTTDAIRPWRPRRWPSQTSEPEMWCHDRPAETSRGQKVPDFVTEVGQVLWDVMGHKWVINGINLPFKEGNHMRSSEAFCWVVIVCFRNYGILGNPIFRQTKFVSLKLCFFPNRFDFYATFQAWCLAEVWLALFDAGTLAQVHSEYESPRAFHGDVKR